MSTRESPEFAMLSYEARALFWMLQPLLDEEGSVECGERPDLYLSLVLRADISLVKNPLEELVSSGVFVIENGVVFDRSFPSRNNGKGSDDEMTEYKKKKKKNKDSGSDNRPGRPPGDPRHRPSVDAWFAVHKLFRGEAPVISGKDTKNLSRLLSRLDPSVAVQEVEARMRTAFTDRWFRDHGDLSMFCSKWNNYKPGLSSTPLSPQGVGPRLVDIDPLTNEHVYSDGSRKKIL